MTRRRLLIIGLQAGIVLLVLGAFGTAGFLEYSAQPGFCDNCHIMEPYYQSWLTSSHNFVPCIECHYAPGIKAEAMGKVQAANQVVKYITRTYGEKPWAEIEDAACTREGCHLEQNLRVVSYGGIRFDHQEHLGELRRGKQLRCTSCHSQIVQGEHLTVTSTTCYLCHFKDRPEGQPLGGCLSCHPSPPNLEYEGVPIDHEQIVRDLVSCVKCHGDVTEGDGAAQQERCWQCHNIASRVEEFGNTDMLHRTHIAEHNVECQQCHTTIQHKVVDLEESFQLDCSNCHTGAHRAQRSMFTGSGGHGVDDSPSAMFRARVSCESCHALPEELPGHEGVSTAGEATCLSCHGVSYAGMLPRWQEAVRERLEKAESAVTRARRLAGRAPPATADSLLAAARENLELVRVGKGAHNIEYADRLLRTAVDQARRAVEAAGIGAPPPPVDLGRPLAEGACQSCHLGVEESDPLRWQRRTFPHRPHTVRAGFDCLVCHTPLSEHGGVRLAGTGSCDLCHHEAAAPEGCDQCHAEGAPADPYAVEYGNFVHAPHDFLDCARCHAGPRMDASGADCTSCHQLHHTATSTCLACHRDTDVRSIHPAAVHTSGCSGCHGDAVGLITSWSRDVCLVCHQDRVQHNAPESCVTCHRMPPLGG